MEPKVGSETDSNELSANQPVMDWLVHCPETEMQGDRPSLPPQPQSSSCFRNHR